jgi:hypothetical protein
MASAGAGGVSLFLEGLKMLPGMVEELTAEGAVPLWVKIIALLVILSVSQHISLSPADIKGALTSLPIYLALTLILTVICGLLGQNAMDKVTGALALFSACLTALFVVVLVSSLVQLAIALPIWLLRKLLGR